MSAVNYDDVQQAIELLLSQNKGLTLQNLREALGHRGSMSTLSKYLQKWKKSRYIDQEVTPNAAVTTPAPDPIFSAVQSVWMQMQGLGQQQLAEKEAFLQSQQKMWEEKESIFQSIIEKQAQEYQETVSQLYLIQQNLEQVQAQCQQLASDLELSQKQSMLLRQEKETVEQIFMKELASFRSQMQDQQLSYQHFCQEQDRQKEAAKKSFEEALKHQNEIALAKQKTLEETLHHLQIQYAVAEQQAQQASSITFIQTQLAQIDRQHQQQMQLLQQHLLSLEHTIAKQKWVAPYPPCTLNRA